MPKWKKLWKKLKLPLYYLGLLAAASHIHYILPGSKVNILPGSKVKRINPSGYSIEKPGELFPFSASITRFRHTVGNSYDEDSFLLSVHSSLSISYFSRDSHYISDRDGDFVPDYYSGLLSDGEGVCRYENLDFFKEKIDPLWEKGLKNLDVRKTHEEWEQKHGRKIKEFKYDEHNGLLGLLQEAVRSVLTSGNNYVRHLDLENSEGNIDAFFNERSSIDNCDIKFPRKKLKIAELANFEISYVSLDLDLDSGGEKDLELNIIFTEDSKVEYNAPPLLKEEQVGELLGKLGIDYNLDQQKLTIPPRQKLSLKKFFAGLARFPEDKIKSLYCSFKCGDEIFSSRSRTELSSKDLERLVNLYEDLTEEKMPEKWILCYVSSK